MAAVRLAESYGWKYSAGNKRVIELSEQALRFADRLPPRDRDLVALRNVFEQGRAAEALHLAQRLTSRVLAGGRAVARGRSRPGRAARGCGARVGEVVDAGLTRPLPHPPQEEA